MSSSHPRPLLARIRRFNRRWIDWLDVPDADPSNTTKRAVSTPPDTTSTTLADVVAEATPNPNAMKYLLPRLQTPRTLTPGKAPTDDPFGELLQLEGVVSVFIMETFLTVLKAPEPSWDEISPRVLQHLRRVFS